jgi:hypothetical protein
MYPLWQHTAIVSLRHIILLLSNCEGSRDLILLRYLLNFEDGAYGLVYVLDQGIAPSSDQHQKVWNSSHSMSKHDGFCKRLQYHEIVG